MRSHADLSRLAEAQHGVVTYRQLRDLGFSKGSISRANESWRLISIHRGVYAVGHRALSPHGRCLAAVLACGPRGVLSHESAAWLWGLLPGCPEEAHVTTATTGGGRTGIRRHHAPTLTAADRTRQEGIALTALPRTFLDLAATGRTRSLERTIERAERLGLLDLDRIDAMLRRRLPGISGSRRLLDALEIYRDPGFTRSRAELLFLDLVKKAGLPRPATNFFVAGHEIDAYWEMERFAVEIDGWSTHRTRAAFESDPIRQEDLKLAGIDSIRITARRIERAPAAISQRLAAHLDRRRRELGST